MKNKMRDPIAIKKKQNICTIDYKKLNSLYEDFVLQKELSAEQKYFPSSFISSKNSLNASSSYSSSDTKPTVKTMPSANPMLVDLYQMENDFKAFFELLQTNSKRESIFYMSPEEIRNEINELIENVNQKTSYVDICAQNQDLLITISELKAKLKNVEKGLRAISSVKRPSSRDSSFKYSVLSNTKNSSKKVEVSDSGCSKHMTGDRSLLKNFVEKFMGTFRFGNDHFATITGYGDYVQGKVTVCHVYYVEGLGHNLFSVEKFYDDDLEVAFCSKTCYMRNLEGDDLLIKDCESNLYTISIFDMVASLPVCLMSKATPIKSWLWHHRLSHLNFGTINDLTKHDLVDGLLKFKYGKDHLCSACERGKSKKASYPPKVVPSNHSKFKLLHIDLCGPMQEASINEKQYNLVIVDDYSQFT
nr:integrase, catalytic region, zinc finger, CCHC-type, peptidase aspartic, catalytic [Tanacetum cinerariifolium]